jgi:hypothetical protein
MFIFEFIEPKESEKIAKLTVHKSGKLGLSKGAMDLLDAENNKYCKFAYNNTDRDKGDKELYMFLFKENDGASFGISKAGEYYYIKAKSLLVDLEIDYEDISKTIIFDIYPMEYEGKTIYKLKKRIIKKK